MYEWRTIFDFRSSSPFHPLRKVWTSQTRARLVQDPNAYLFPWLLSLGSHCFLKKASETRIDLLQYARRVSASITHVRHLTRNWFLLGTTSRLYFPLAKKNLVTLIYSWLFTPLLPPFFLIILDPPWLTLAPRTPNSPNPRDPLINEFCVFLVA